jgi:hypothetical protein
MRGRSAPRPTSLEVQAFYALGALARAANVDIDKLRRVLRANDIIFIREGRALFVPMSEIEVKIPPLWASICAAERVRRQAERNDSPTWIGAPGAPGDKKA